MNDHTHEEDAYSRVLDMHWCKCGWELKDGRWRYPRTGEGMRRKFQWQ